MVFYSPWVTSLYCSPVVGSVKVFCYRKISYLIKKTGALPLLPSATR